MIHWAIVGGESGPGARPMHPDWVRLVRDQCNAADVPVFFKQWGEWLPSMDQPMLQSSRFTHVAPDGQTWDDGLYIPPGGLTGPVYGMIGVGKKAAGALLDGREWREFPDPAAGAGG